ncbi:hypothetical protein QYE76_036835 [Lolium multiflorum]|uniref:Uncharacterized protein n=1 Tax=Lolium multiflorum TaxID=4521 RepID=A0AAD8R2Q2_LOLMU|nr:hypothetical protein QYE76_036835 [Lolium multiflorum]
MHKLVLEQKSEIERLSKKEAESQQTIEVLEECLKVGQDLLTKCPSVDEISAKLKTLEAEHESLQNTLKESHENEIKLKKELEDKHVQAMSVMAEKLKASNKRVNTLGTKLKAAEAEAADIDEMIFLLLGFERRKDDGLSRTEAYEEVGNSIEDLIEACRKIAMKLSLKKAHTKVIDTMTKMMLMVPELIGDWQESSARGVAAHVLTMCKAHFPTLDFAQIAAGVPKATNIKNLLAETCGFDTLFSNRVNHSMWYEKHDLPAVFSEDEEEEEEEGFGSSAS